MQFPQLSVKPVMNYYELCILPIIISVLLILLVYISQG